MATRRIKNPEENKSRLPKFGFSLDPALTREIVGVLLMALGAITLLSLLAITPGFLTYTWGRLLPLLFGWGAYVLPFAAFGISALALRRGEPNEFKIVFLSVPPERLPRRFERDVPHVGDRP
ncbi:MAG: hypothetical protein M1570_03020, partial [Chloroflexi bacterium]|nr:hypothetical protein [Chloroflexota bacterium]